MGSAIRDSQERPRARLEVWIDAMHQVGAMHGFSAGLPNHGRLGLTARLRRGAISGPSNFAEGAARRSIPELPRFLSAARGTLAEPDPQVRIAARLGSGERSGELDALIDRIFAKLNAFIRALNKTAIREDAGSYESRIPDPESPC